jgi:hypothetical protein
MSDFFAAMRWIASIRLTFEYPPQTVAKALLAICMCASAVIGMRFEYFPVDFVRRRYHQAWSGLEM